MVTWKSAFQLPPSTPSSASSFDQAATLMRRNASQYGPSASVMPPQQAAPYSAEHTAVRLSVKLFNCTPAELPDNLRQQLTGQTMTLLAITTSKFVRILFIEHVQQGG